MLRTLFVSAATVGFAIAQLTFSTPVQAGEHPLKVMVAGDSITQGFGGRYGSYRYWLWHEFQRQGVDVNFVGPRDNLAPNNDRTNYYWSRTSIVTMPGGQGGG